MKALMIHVEKAVRPLNITQAQRGAIREELLTHLQGIYEEELAACGDSEQAIETAIRRFGPAEEISHNLRDALPWYSGLLAMIPWYARVRSWPESMWRIAWRGWMTGLLCWIPLGIAWCSLLVYRDKMSATQAILLWFLFAALALVYLIPFVGMVGSLHGVYGLKRSLSRTVLFGLSSCVGQLMIYSLIRLYVKPTLNPFVFGLAFLFPIVLGLLASTQTFREFVQGDAEKEQRLGEWEQLVIDK